MSQRRPSPSSRGFSLLEVMVAIAILGLTLTVILSAQGGLAASNRSAANMGQAVALGRCMMTETEEKLLKLGFQELDQKEVEIPCCAEATPEGYTCDLAIEKIELPSMNMGGNDAGAFLTGAISSTNNAAGGPGLNLSGDGGLQAMGQSLASQFGGGGSGAEGLLGMVMGIIYPSMKPMYEASIRRVTVTVKWKEGPNARDLPITQFVTNPQRGGFAGSALMGDGGVMDFAPSGGTSPTGTAPGGLGTAPRPPGGPR